MREALKDDAAVVEWLRELAGESIAFPPREKVIEMEQGIVALPETVQPAASLAPCVLVYLRVHRFAGDRVWRVLYRFAGQVHHYPGLPEVEALARQVQVVAALNHDPRTEVVGRLASIFGAEKRDISKCYTAATGRSLDAERRRRAEPSPN